mmetsp:Transcript_13690/g.12137  ORF Transcript_13690/g.12137 Transcript_13690/m.12137 type:complete len:105 (+) Transcript_13690:32-346(+)
MINLNKLELKRKIQKKMNGSSPKYFKIKPIEMINEEDELAKLELQKILKRDKMLIYAKLVSESYRPKVSWKKKHEMKEIIRKLGHQSRKPQPSYLDKSRPMHLK